MVSAIVGLQTIYKSYFSKEEKIVGKAVFVNYTLPPHISSKIKDVSYPLSDSEYESIKLILSSNGTKENIFKISSEINEFYKTKYRPYEDVNSFLRFSRNFWIIEIANEGTRQADNVTIDFKGSGTYQIGDQDVSTPNSFKDSILIGSLLPSRKAIVSIWTDSYPITNPLVTHTNGAEVVRVRQTEYEPTFWTWLIPTLLISTLLGLLVLVLGIYLGQNRKVRIVSFDEQVSNVVVQQQANNREIKQVKSASRGRKNKPEEPDIAESPN